MTLKYEIEDIGTVDEAVRGLYIEQDGKFVLSVAGMPQPENTDGLKSALEKERKAARDLEKKVKRWESLGKSDEEVAEMLRAQEERETKKAEEEGDFKKILEQHKGKWEQEKSELNSELEAARSSERKAIIETSLMAALSKTGATQEGVDLLPEQLGRRIKFEREGGERVIKILSADGETPMAGSGKDGTATFDDLVKEASDKWPSLFKGSGAGGTGKAPNSAGRSGKTKKSDFKSEKERAAFVTEHGYDAYKSLPD